MQNFFKFLDSYLIVSKVMLRYAELDLVLSDPVFSSSFPFPDICQ